MRYEEKEYYTYIMMNGRNTVIYVGITNDIERRTAEHKHGKIKGFTQKYNVKKLVYYETYSNPQEAIDREKQIKRWSKYKKINLIRKKNPELKDLAEDWNIWFLPDE